MSSLTLLFLITLLAWPALGQVKLTASPDKIEISIRNQPYSTFYMAGEGVTKPYLWPVRAASGTSVTRAWPMEKLPEEDKEKKDHPHQRGIWFAHENVNGIDFWNNEASYTEPPRRGRMVLKKVGEVTSGKDKGSFTAGFDWTDRQGNVVLTETRVMTFYSEPELRTIDFDITLTSVQNVVWGDAKDGAFGIRLRPILDEQGGTGKIVNADGLVGEAQVWGKPSNWCDYSGTIRGEKVGVAIFDHPENPRHPVRWHVRGYGLFAANPFGLSVFTKDNSENGALTVDAGKSLRFRYRVVVHPGDAKSAGLPTLYEKFASRNSLADQRGGPLFVRQCGFCHGRDAGGGEDGPDLTRSKLVAEDKGGDKIAPVIRNGRPEHGMPKFDLPDPDIASLAAFIHDQKIKAESQKGGRRGVDVSDLQTGNAEAGKQYFNGTGKCASCHSPSGDLAGIAKRYEGLKLEQRMLYPKDAKAKITVTLPSGETLSGELAYRDEFTVGMRDAARHYRSWPAAQVKFTVDEPAEAHADLLARYTDADIHNLMAYLQTLR
ncbi:MAG: DUF6807 family protein [Bryobacteraceae bacterium]